MTANLVSSDFQLIIAGVDRTAVMKSITLSQPDTSAQRYAPITGAIALFVPFGYEADYTYSSSQSAAEQFAQGVLVQYKVANDSGALVWHPLSGQALYLMREPNSPDSSNILTLDIGCALAYAMAQRTPDDNVSGVEVGTNTARNTIVERCLAASDISSYSIPSLPKPFNVGLPKIGGSFAEMAGKLCGAVNHVLYCNSTGTVVASPIDFDASPIATLTIGKDEAEWEPVNTNSIPTVNQLTIAGTTEVLDVPSFPIVIELAPTTIYDYRYSVTDFREVNCIDSFTRRVHLREQNTITILSAGVSQLLRPATIVEELDEFDGSDRFVRHIVNTFTAIYFGSSYSLHQSGKVITEYFYAPNDLKEKEVITSYGSTFSPTGIAAVTPQSRVTTTYTNIGNNFWTRNRVTESPRPSPLFPFGYTLTPAPINIAVNSTNYPAIAYLTLGDVDWIVTKTDPVLANDDSNRPSQTERKQDKKTKSKEIVATVYAQPLAGAPIKNKEQPERVDFLVDESQAIDYGKVAIRLRMGRKQAKQILLQLTDELISGLRPRARIDIIFDGMLGRYLVDAIAFSQEENERSIGFICDLISTSPVATPSIVYALSTPTNNLSVSAQAQPATVSIECAQTTDVFIAQAQPATASIEIAVNIDIEVSAQSAAASVSIQITT
jgi:hypothetical protein